MLPGQPADRMIGRAHGPHPSRPLLEWLEDVRASDAARVGGRAAALGEMYSALRGPGTDHPEGFVITVDGWDCLLDTAVNGGAWDLVGAELRAVCPVAFHNTTLRQALEQVLDEANPEDQLDLHMRAALARALVLASPVPEPVARALGEGFKHLLHISEGDAEVAVHASVVPDTPAMPSFTGQYESYLDVHGVPGLQAAWRKCCASSFTGRALGYQLRRGMDPLARRLGVLITRMARSSRAYADRENVGGVRY
jgi:pyruvate,water dikinase